MKALVITALLASATSLAAAAPAAPAAPAPSPSHAVPIAARCVARGDALFQIDVALIPGMHADGIDVPATTILYKTGAWTRTSAHAAHGCLTAAQLATVTADLARAPWIVKTAEVTCAAIGPTKTTYAAFGRTRFSETMCGADYLDDVSEKSLRDIVSILSSS